MRSVAEGAVQGCGGAAREPMRGCHRESHVADMIEGNNDRGEV